MSFFPPASPQSGIPARLPCLQSRAADKTRGRERRRGSQFIVIVMMSRGARCARKPLAERRYPLCPMQKKAKTHVSGKSCPTRLLESLYIEHAARCRLIATSHMSATAGSNLGTRETLTQQNARSSEQKQVSGPLAAAEGLHELLEARWLRLGAIRRLGLAVDGRRVRHRPLGQVLSAVLELGLG